MNNDLSLPESFWWQQWDHFADRDTWWQQEICLQEGHVHNGRAIWRNPYRSSKRNAAVSEQSLLLLLLEMRQEQEEWERELAEEWRLWEEEWGAAKAGKSQAEGRGCKTGRGILEVLEIHKTRRSLKQASGEREGCYGHQANWGGRHRVLPHDLWTAHEGLRDSRDLLSGCKPAQPRRTLWNRAEAVGAFTEELIKSPLSQV